MTPQTPTFSPCPRCGGGLKFHGDGLVDVWVSIACLSCRLEMSEPCGWLKDAGPDQSPWEPIEGPTARLRERWNDPAVWDRRAATSGPVAELLAACEVAIRDAIRRPMGVEPDSATVALRLIRDARILAAELGAGGAQKEPDHA
jgi:hypothetical protein